jgi:hypothetical protein
MYHNAQVAARCHSIGPSDGLVVRRAGDCGSEIIPSSIDDPSACGESLTRACKKLKIHRITHHDVRHLFATRCIESGVDIPTVSRWLGRSDGGALAMKTCGHLRRERSAAMAPKAAGDAAHLAIPANSSQSSR